jgi:hypothetical protein
MALAGGVEPVFEDGHGMDPATPFAHQPGAGLERDPWVEGAPFADQLDRLGHSAQPAPGSRAEPALRPLLHPMGDRPHQQIPAQPGWRLAAMQPPPADPHIMYRQRFQCCDLGIEVFDGNG